MLIKEARLSHTRSSFPPPRRQYYDDANMTDLLSLGSISLTCPRCLEHAPSRQPLRPRLGFARAGAAPAKPAYFNSPAKRMVKANHPSSRSQPAIYMRPLPTYANGIRLRYPPRRVRRPDRNRVLLATELGGAQSCDACQGITGCETALL